MKSSLRMHKVLFILHQITSVPGDIGNKFHERGYDIEICRPPLGDDLPCTKSFSFLGYGSVHL